MTRPVNASAPRSDLPQYSQVQTGLRVEPMLERMAAPQLIRMAARYAPGDDARQMQKARSAIEKALNSPRSLDALIASLSPLEIGRAHV